MDVNVLTASAIATLMAVAWKLLGGDEDAIGVGAEMATQRQRQRVADRHRHLDDGPRLGLVFFI